MPDVQSHFIAEMVGTMILVLLGDGVVANVLLKGSKGRGSGWIVIATGWGLAVAIAVYVTGWVSGAHLNPAITLGFVVVGIFEVQEAIPYVLAQMIGGLIGATLVWLMYKPHWKETEDPDAKLSVFCTTPAIRAPAWNLVAEIIGTAMLLIGVLGIVNKNNSLTGGMGPLAIGVLVWSIGLSLGGPTGYAINPARDLAPRIAHALLPIPGKGSSDWAYAWVPVVGPLVGGALGAIIYQLILLHFWK